MMRSARDARLSLHPQPGADAAVRGPHHLSQPERHHAGVAQAARGWTTQRPGGVVDAHASAGRGAVRRAVGSLIKIRDLSGEPAHRATLERMRQAVADWMARIDDQGRINEAEMIQRMWPGGVQPETATPYILPRRTTDTPARVATMVIREPMEVVIYVPTQSASIGYTTDEGSKATWRLYTGPIRIDRSTTLRAKAIRYGYKESAEARVVFTSER